jgi:hypothetical protein
VIGQALIGGEPDPAHADHHDLGVAGVAMAFLRVQVEFVLGR